MSLLKCPIRRIAKVNPSTIAIKSPDLQIDYLRLDRQVSFLCKRLTTLNVKAGDRVAILADNSILTIPLMFALYRLKASGVFLSLQLTPSDWNEQLEVCNVKLVFGEKTFLEKLNTSATTITFEVVKDEWFLGLNKDDDNSEVNEDTDPTIDLEQEAAVIFTSSVTGHKKGVILKLGNFEASARESNTITKITPGDYWGVSLPLYHVGGLGIIFRTILSGAGSCFLNNFSPPTILSQIKKGNLTHLSMVPTVLESLIDFATEQGPENLSVLKKIKVVVLAGAASSARLLNKIIQHDLPVLSAWGMTETTAHCTCMALDDPRQKVTTVGKPFSHTKLKLLNDDDLEVKDHLIQGEILVKGPTVCSGFLYPEAPHPIIENGWLHTGDLGMFDGDGYLTIVGRKDDMFISGGENIHAGEIETVAKKFDKIKDLAVIPVPHSKWGHRPILIAEVKVGNSILLEELRVFLSDKLAKIKIPDELIIVDKLPRTAIGKIDYKKLKLQYASTEREA